MESKTVISNYNCIMPKRTINEHKGKDKVDCYICGKKMRFDYLQDHHFPEVHNKTYDASKNTSIRPVYSFFNLPQGRDESASSSNNVSKESQGYAESNVNVAQEHEPIGTNISSIEISQAIDSSGTAVQRKILDTVIEINDKIDRLSNPAKSTNEDKEEGRMPCNVLRLKAARSIAEIMDLITFIQPMVDKPYLSCRLCVSADSSCTGPGFFSTLDVVEETVTGNLTRNFG